MGVAAPGPSGVIVEFAPPRWPPAALTICPQDCECAGSPLIGFGFSVVFASVVYHCRSSCPENAQGELACTAFSVPLPVISPANAALVARAIMAATATAATSARRVRSNIWVLSKSHRVGALPGPIGKPPVADHPNPETTNPALVPPRCNTSATPVLALVVGVGPWGRDPPSGRTRTGTPPRP